MPTARADTPLDLDAGGRITDTVGALGHRRAQVEAALDRLSATHHVQLFVTYVRDFSGRSAHAWADATADRNGLGQHELLLAIAVQGRQYAVSAARDSGFAKAQLEKVSGIAIAPALRQNDWAGAAIGAADGYLAVLQGEPVRTPVIRPGNSDPGGMGLLPGGRRVWVPLGGAIALACTAMYLRSRRAALRRRGRAGREPPLLPTTTEPGFT
ncbi:TPM domain-containing protein, partial [Streptomyces sp. NPDC049577]|uniref:TPM domain-containing protein n=1 Tax=Streptomyces sp. NPDC049577 TaxID=3155153 RepID=UPI00343B5CB8